VEKRDEIWRREFREHTIVDKVHTKGAAMELGETDFELLEGERNIKGGRGLIGDGSIDGGGEESPLSSWGNWWLLTAAYWARKSAAFAKRWRCLGRR